MNVATERVYTLADLAHWPAGGTALAVIGQPVAHSLSPTIQNAALAELARTQPRFSDWRYFKFDIAPAALEGALRLFHENKFQGLNLTVPHKALVVQHLHSSHGFVREAGAANTLKYTAEWWDGYNTDGHGLSAALRADLAVDLAGAHVILLGAGGAARAAAVECLQSDCASLWIGNRTPANRDALLTTLQSSKAFATESRLKVFDPRNLPANLPGGAVVINATSLGMKPDDESPLDLARIPRPAKVYDMIYRPPQTALLRQAAGLGLAHANGLSMLIHQGARSLELWTGAKVSVPVMQAAARSVLNPA